MKRRILPLFLIVGLLMGFTTACDEDAAVQLAIHEYFPGSQNAKAKRVAQCESGMNPNAVSPGGQNHGLFQINLVHRNTVQSMGYSWSQIYDPFVNARVARHIFDAAGGSWSPWGCHNA